MKNSRTASRRGRWPRPAAAGFAAVAAVLALAACSSSASSGAGGSAAPVRVGYLLPLTGVFTSNGTDEQDGFKLGLKNFGAVVDGHPITVTYLNTEGTPAIALSAAMFASDERVRRMVLAAVETGLPELRLWGEADMTGADFSGTGLDGAASLVAHRLSAAARAFKAQALAAAAVCGESPADTEVFRRGAGRGLGRASAF